MMCASVCGAPLQEGMRFMQPNFMILWLEDDPRADCGITGSGKSPLDTAVQGALSRDAAKISVGL